MPSTPGAYPQVISRAFASFYVLKLSVSAVSPHTELNVFTIEGSTEPDRQTPMWGRGRLDHLGLQASSAESFDTIRQLLIEHGASELFAK